MANTEYGSDGNDTIFADPSGDGHTIDGQAGNDELNGGTADDYLIGSTGNDTLVAEATDGVNGYGHDYLDGGTGNDVVAGQGGNDTILGGIGNDYLNGDGYIDNHDPRDGNDLIYAGSGADHVLGEDGNDTIYADGSFADGQDVLEGGNGDDLYIVDGSNLAFTDSGGYDRLEISADVALSYANGVNVVEIEDITLTGTGAFSAEGNSLDNVIAGNNAANALKGDAGADTLLGGDGNDTLDGGVGYVDVLRGGHADDTYVVGDFDDIYEAANQGYDTVRSSVRWVLGDNFEDLVLTGGANINGFGNGLSNHLTGNDGNNYLQGFAGLDALAGGGGNDYYELGDLSSRPFLGSTYDSVSEGLNGGNDTVNVTALDNPDTFTSVERYTLGANIEVGQIAGTIAFNLTGNELDNRLVGNLAANALAGVLGNDTLDGGAGLDTLTGGAGDDAYILNDLTVVDDQSGPNYDTVVETAGGGVDKVFVSYQGLDRYYLDPFVENVEVTGTAALTVIGNELGNQMIGNGAHNLIYGLGGRDVLLGGAGFDELVGGTGNDTYLLSDVTNIGGSLQFDSVGEAKGEGVDNVEVSSGIGRLTYVLDANIENADVVGAANFNLVGNGLATGSTETMPPMS